MLGLYVKNICFLCFLLLKIIVCPKQENKNRKEPASRRITHRNSFPTPIIPPILVIRVISLMRNFVSATDTLGSKCTKMAEAFDLKGSAPTYFETKVIVLQG